MCVPFADRNKIIVGSNKVSEKEINEIIFAIDKIHKVGPRMCKGAHYRIGLHPDYIGDMKEALRDVQKGLEQLGYCLEEISLEGGPLIIIIGKKGSFF